MADDPARSMLQAELRGLALARATRNERVLAGVRLAAFTGTATVDTVSWWVPGSLAEIEVPWALPASSFAVLLVAAAVGMWVFQRGYQPWMAVGMPAIDLVGLVSAVTGARSALGAARYTELGGDAVAAIGCMILALTGTLRGSRRSALASLATGALAYGLLLGTGLPLATWLILFAMLLATSLLALENVRGQEAALTAEAAQTTLARFLPDGVVQRAWSAPLELLGPPRMEDVAVLVTDLRGFTAWSESRAPDEVLRMLDGVQGRLAAMVAAEGGTVDKFLGDGMLAVFTGPSAADAALRVARAVVALPADPIAVGLGLHAGPAVLGTLGSGSRLEFTVLGDTVNTAARLEGLTKEHGVRAVVSEAVLERCTARPDDLVPLGEVGVRGRAVPLRLWGWR